MDACHVPFRHTIDPWYATDRRQTHLRLPTGEKNNADPPENDLVELSLSDVKLKYSLGNFSDKASKRVLLGLKTKAQQTTKKLKMALTWKELKLLAKRVTQTFLRR